MREVTGQEELPAIVECSRRSLAELHEEGKKTVEKEGELICDLILSPH